jgi:Tfp pilus assembly major pilin PilA
MDKSKDTTAIPIRQKKGFALIITLSVLTIIIALTSVLIGYFDKVRRDATYTKALIQGNIYYSDVKKMLQKNKKRENIYKSLYLMPVSLSSSHGKFSVMVQCRPLANGVNINWFSGKQQMQEQYDIVEKLFEIVVQNYGIEDASRLREMIEEEIGRPNKKFVQKEQSRLLQKNGIISYKQFEKILQRYQLEVDDPKISSVPWEKLFVFNLTFKDPNLNMIDANYISVELISLLFGVDIATVKEGWIEGEISLKNFLNEIGESDKYDTKIFTDKFLPMSWCKVSYGYANERYMFKFVDILKEVKSFEFYGKQ